MKKHYKISITLLSIILMFGFQLGAQKIWYVTPTGAGAKDGSSWENAFDNLDHALNSAQYGDQIWVSKGTYIPNYIHGTGTNPRLCHFRMVDGVAIYGGFSGNETSVDQRRNFRFGEENETILSGDRGVVGNKSDNCYHVFYHPMDINLSGSAILDGFTIRDGNADSIGYDCGGAMWNYNAAPTIRNCTFISNSALQSGGAIYNLSSPNFINCVFINNVASAGGAIYTYSISFGNSELINCAFIKNSAGDGGAICNFSSSLKLINCTFTSNFATNGGGMYNMYSSPIFQNSIIWGNKATTYGEELYLAWSTVSLSYCCYGNETNDIYNQESTLTTENCITANPRFVIVRNDTTRPYVLAGTSPCINAGNNEYNTEPYEIRGRSRIQNDTIDIGACEWTSGSDPEIRIFYVNCAEHTDTNGFSWGSAFKTLQTALDVSESGDQIWVAKGIYKPSYDYGLGNNSNPRLYHFRLKNGVAIYGGFKGSERSISERYAYGLNQINETILSGDLNDNGRDSNDCYHVFYHPSSLGLTNSAILDGFTIKGGNANGAELNMLGGGMYNDGCSPTIINCNFVANFGSTGGGIYIFDSSSLIMKGCTFTLNSSNSGGAVYSTLSSPIFINCLINKNQVNLEGGGIYNNHSLPILVNCTIADNSSKYGGGVYNAYNSEATFNNCIIWANESSEYGNQFYLNSGKISLNYSCFGWSGGDVFIEGGQFMYDTHCINLDPLFAGSTLSPLYPYSIVWGSPCIDKGNNNYNSEAYDIRGQARIQNITIDIGAYEFTMGVDPGIKIIYVNSSASGSNDGTSWKNAYRSLQTALNSACTGDQIWVAKGTYKPSYDYGLGGGSRYYHFRMINGVAIYGGFAGTETSVSQRTNFGVGQANETILSGDIGTEGDNSDNCYHVFYHPDNAYVLSNSSILDGFTIKNGNANTLSAPHNHGGGMFNGNQSNPIIKNCTFIQNDGGCGGAVYIGGNQSQYINCLFYSNTTSDGGGAVYCNNSNPTFINCVISNNSSTYGGGVRTYYASPTLKNCIVWGNTASSTGRQFYLEAGTTTLNYSCYANGTYDVYATYGAFSADSSCTTSDPLFVDANNNDFRVLGISSCVDAGNNDYVTEQYDIRGAGYPRKLNKTTGAAGTVDMGAYEYKVGSDPYKPPTVVMDNSTSTPAVFLLKQNYPNPFNSLTTISYELPERNRVRLVIYDILGKEIMNLIDREQEPGRYNIKFDASSLPSGIYFYKLEAGKFVDVKKLVLLK